MTRIPVQVTASPGFPGLDALALDLVQVTQDGNVAKEIGRFPGTGGAAEVPDVPLADPVLRRGRQPGPRRARRRPQVLVDVVRNNLPNGFQLAGVDVGADPQGRSGS